MIDEARRIRKECIAKNPKKVQILFELCPCYVQTRIGIFQIFTF
jgi:hypothetical protein